MKKIFKLYLFSTFVLLISFNNNVLGQEDTETQPQETPAPEINVIDLNDISSETEKLGQRIRRLQDILKPRATTFEIDSLLHTVFTGVIEKGDTLIERLPNFSQRELKREVVEWTNYKSKLADYQSTINSRIKDLNTLNDEVVEEIKRWEKTKEDLNANTESKQLFSNMDTMIFRMQDIVDITVLRLDSVFMVQKKLTDVVLKIDDIIAEISQTQLQLKKDYFAFDSYPIWSIDKIETASTDSLAVEETNTEKINKGYRHDIAELSSFITTNLKTFVLQLFFVIMLYVLLMVVRRKWYNFDNELTSPLEKEAKIVIANPLSASLSVGLLISAFFYEALIPIFIDYIILLILIATTVLLPKLTHKKILPAMGLILFVYVIGTIENYISDELLLTRFILLCYTAILSLTFIIARKVMNQHPESFKGISVFRKFVVPVYLVFMLIAFTTNLIGMVNLSRFLTNAVLTSVGLGSVVYVSIKVFSSIFILLFKLRGQFNLTTLATLVQLIQKRIQPFLMLVGIIIWIFFTLAGFEVFEYLKLWVNDLLSIEWKIGAMSVSVGGILAFIFIFLITMFVAKIVANIFQDEWLIKALPRGIAPAISLIARIILISTGLYMALSAAGFDLGKIGILLGALGVGIGFGLQSIVLNFISGLILAFERPINLGDAIEVEQEFGIVTSIGVRASNIKTYKGSEVIIPNGDLVSKKVVNWTLSNRDRRSRILMKTSSEADPIKVIELFNRIAAEHPSVFKKPAPETLFFGYNQEGNLDFALIYWTTFSNTLKADSEIALKIYQTLKIEGIQAPIPKWKIVGDENNSGSRLE